MERIEEFVDERKASWCIHCGRPLGSLDTNEDHVPSKSLLRKPRPHNLPVVTICTECNTSFSLDEQYAVTFLSCTLAGSTEPEKQPNASAARALAESPALRTLIERSRTVATPVAGEIRTLWKPDLGRILRVVLKNARGHAYFEYGEPMLENRAHIFAVPLETLTVSARNDFEGATEKGSIAPWPEVGSRMITRLATGTDLVGQWVVVQEGIYRYSVDQTGVLRVRSVMFEYLAAEVAWDL